MKARTAARIAWFSFAVAAISAGLGLYLHWLQEGPSIVKLGQLGEIAPLLSLSGIGALIAARQPHNKIGWLMCAVGTVGVVDLLMSAYAVRALVIAPGSLPAGVWVAWLDDVIEAPGLVAFLVFFPLLFPDGHLLSLRWRVVAWLAGFVIGAQMVWAAFMPRMLVGDTVGGQEVGVAPNPLGLDRLVEPLRLLDQISGPLFLLLLLAALASIIVRFRRSEGVERLQIKWVLYALAVVVLIFVFFVLEPPIPNPPEWSADLIFGFLFMGVPIAAGLAILRYRLYDIDFIINRTLVYGALTGVLALVYVGGVVGVGGLVREATGQQDNGLVIAATTLVVAALFRPARARIQGFIDRRFYRRRYDAARTLEAFSARLRDEVDLETMRLDLLTVVHNTMQPRRVSIWLK
jgi:hypothetical protein